MEAHEPQVPERDPRRQLAQHRRKLQPLRERPAEARADEDDRERGEDGEDVDPRVLGAGGERGSGEEHAQRNEREQQAHPAGAAHARRYYRSDAPASRGWGIAAVDTAPGYSLAVRSTVGWFCFTVAILFAMAWSGCDLVTQTDFSIYGDSSLVGATVLVDGVPRGTFSGTRVVRTRVVESLSDPLHWPAQVVGDTIFVAGGLNGGWSGKVRNGWHQVVLRAPDGRELRAKVELNATEVWGLASFDRRTLRTRIGSY